MDRAKGVLQKQLGLTEPEAFRWIQKTAMDLRLSMREVAEASSRTDPASPGPKRSRPPGVRGHELATRRPLIRPRYPFP